MSASWVRSSLPPMLGPLPAWTVIPLPFMLFNFGMTTMMLFAITIGVGIYLKHKGRTMMWTVRRFRTYLRAYKMNARSLGYRRAVTMDVAIHDFDFEKWRES